MEIPSWSDRCRKCIESNGLDPDDTIDCPAGGDCEEYDEEEYGQ